MELPRQVSRQLPDTLTPSEVQKIMARCNLDDLLGVRDRAILETFYSTGIRRMELVNLCVYDVADELVLRPRETAIFFGNLSFHGSFFYALSDIYVKNRP